jgi:hypothetical protein
MQKNIVLIFTPFLDAFTITICPGPLVHRMGKMSWRNDNGEEGLILVEAAGTGKHCIISTFLQFT